MALAYELISTVTVGAGGAASISFTSIPQTGSHLVLVTSLQGDQSFLGIQINSHTNYNGIFEYNNGPTSTQTGIFTSYGLATIRNGIYNTTSSYFADTTLIFANYNLSKSKTIFSETVMPSTGTPGITFSGMTGTTGIAINSLTLTPRTTQTGATAGTGFTQYSTASLYMITKGSGGATIA